MKLILLLLFFSVPLSALAMDDTNILAAGNWSAPVSNRDGFAIRARLLICQAPWRGTTQTTDIAVYVDLQEYSSFVGDGLEVYCEPARLQCQLRDGTGSLIPESAGGFGGGIPGPCWVNLPAYCTFRMRASVFGGGLLKDGGLAVYLHYGRGWWDVHPNATNDFFLSGTFTVSPPPERSRAASLTNRNVWEGTLNLPPLKLPIKRP